MSGARYTGDATGDTLSTALADADRRIAIITRLILQALNLGVGFDDGDLRRHRGELREALADRAIVAHIERARVGDAREETP
jgi:hypothetical protein